MSAVSTISCFGGLLPKDYLDRVALAEQGIVGTDPESYGLAKRERLNDAIVRSWNRLTRLWQSFSSDLGRLSDSDHATKKTRQDWLLPLFEELGFGGLRPVNSLMIEDKVYPITHEWSGRVPILLLGAKNIPLDRRTPGVAGASTSSPHGLVQEFLNRSDDHLWGIVSNGNLLRLLRNNPSMTRQAYLEFDLEAMFSGDQFADFSLLWLSCHRTRFEGEVASKCFLERWVEDSENRGTRALDGLREGVEAAIEELGTGYLAHPKNSALRKSLVSGALTTTDFNHQLLRTIYRLLFLLVAENRELLLDPKSSLETRKLYFENYSISRVRALSRVRRGTKHDDVWESLRVVIDALAVSGQPLLGLAPLGSFLWSPEATPALNGCRLQNSFLLEAIRRLGEISDPKSKVKRQIDYKNLGAEELGSVYESLLELHADVDVDQRTFVLTHAAGNERKSTGSYYTPTALIEQLLDTALEPVIERTIREASDPEAAILDLAVLDPACGSGHFLIAAAHRIAHRLAAVRSGDSEPSASEVRSALRDVVGRCIHGIDINPMAVELCKVSLWVEAMEPGKPLSFLEHRIVCGNALLGTTPKLISGGIPDAAFPSSKTAILPGDDIEVAKSWRKRNKAELGQRGQIVLDLVDDDGDSVPSVGERIRELDELPDDSIFGMDVKQRKWRELLVSDERRIQKLKADAWCAAFVQRRVEGAVPVTSEILTKLDDQVDQIEPQLFDTIETLSSAYQFLHLHIAFAHVFTEKRGRKNEITGSPGGFDAVLGNPPWERIEMQQQEWFAFRDPSIAQARNTAERDDMIAKLEIQDPILFGEFQTALRFPKSESFFVRKSGRYELTGQGKINTYTVFTELMKDATSGGGRVGVIIPSGIATDATTQEFFQHVVEGRRIHSLYDFENRNAIFDIHRSFKFCLLTLTGSDAPCSAAEFVFFALEVSDLDNPDAIAKLSAEDFAMFNPNTKTSPIFRSTRDVEILKGIYQRVPVLVNKNLPPGRR